LSKLVLFTFEIHVYQEELSATFSVSEGKAVEHAGFTEQSLTSTSNEVREQII